MKNLRLFLLLLTLIAQPLFGSEKSSLFTVDMGKLFRSSDFGKKIISTNNIARQELQNENEELESLLLSEEIELSEQRKILPSDEFRRKALAFDEKVSIIRTEQAKKEENLKNKVRKEEAEFYKRIYPLLYELLLDRSGLILIDQRNVILWDSTVDITEEAILLINQVLGKSIKSN
jgi:Outer membrane protein